MELPFEVASATDALLAALRETEPFQTCARLRESVMEDEVSRRLLERFTRAEAALRMAAAAGVEPKPEDAREFERLSALLYESDEVSAYLLSRMSAQRLAAAVMERVAEAAFCQESATPTGNTTMNPCATSANTAFTGTAGCGISSGPY